MTKSGFERDDRTFGEFLMPPLPTRISPTSDMIPPYHIVPSAEVPIRVDAIKVEPSDATDSSRLMRVLHACGRQVKENFLNPRLVSFFTSRKIIY